MHDQKTNAKSFTGGKPMSASHRTAANFAATAPDNTPDYATDHAVVVGGSIAGLMTARVLTQYFARVTVIERDHLPAAPTFRTGVPHARHAHGLLVRGQQIMERYFPGMTDALIAQDAVRANAGRDLALSIGGVRVQPFASSLDIVACSRPLLEYTLYRQVRDLPQVTFITGCNVMGLRTDADNRRVTGIRLQPRDVELAPVAELNAELVVDASGRHSKAPAWLEALGYAPPTETEVNAQAGYASRIYRRTPDRDGAPPHAVKMIYGMPQAPDQSRGCILVPLERDRWQVTLTGMNGDHPPTDEAGFLAFARSVPVPEFYPTISQLSPMTDAYGFRGGANRLRHYEKLPRYLEGLLAVGDAVYALNPVYGQGMTVAAMGVETLDACLQAQRQRTGRDQTGLARTFFKQLARINAAPWQMATGQDARWSSAAAQIQLDPVTQLIQRYFDLVLQTLISDGEVAETFSHVQNMLTPPSALFHPRVVGKVIRNQIRRGKGQRQPQMQPATQEGYV
jgi:2-polyprenyl-6-methoxyphenol hydroxylase-like FAD-dependent oxidoreductase